MLKVSDGTFVNVDKRFGGTPRELVNNNSNGWVEAYEAHDAEHPFLLNLAHVVKVYSV